MLSTQGFTPSYSNVIYKYTYPQKKSSQNEHSICFFIQLFPLHHTGVAAIVPTPPVLRIPARLVSLPAANLCHRSPKTQKVGKISPAAKRFPLSPFREAVKPPLFDPVSRGRLLGDKNSDFFTHRENLKKLRKHPPRLVTIVEVDFILGSHFHTIKLNLGRG